VADLLLDEQRVDAVLDEVADIGVAQAVRGQLGGLGFPPKRGGSLIRLGNG